LNGWGVAKKRGERGWGEGQWRVKPKGVVGTKGGGGGTGEGGGELMKPVGGQGEIKSG